MGLKADIAAALVARIELVTTANGYSQDLKTVTFDKVKINILDYDDYELPAVQLIDLSALYSHEMSRSKTSWSIALEICMRTTQNLGTVSQVDLWNLQEDVVRAIMAEPNLGVTGVIHVRLLDAVTDLHMLEPNYIATVGLEVLYYEPITRDNC
jgi:hypothetical protein